MGCIFPIGLGDLAEVPIKNARREKSSIGCSPIPHRSESIPAGQVRLEGRSKPTNLRAEAYHGLRLGVPTGKDRKRVRWWLRSAYQAYTGYIFA